ncbi:class I SAM-dependent DNA methyltransferase [Roseivirga sp.]|uniref:class I SAM-dependent DNA methyltransferase n=1 Tax=Roseivirga sp. TaxID=1964215 RepID=UPI003B8AB833
MNIAQIDENLQKLMKSFKKESFIYDLLLAYGLPKASITRLQKGSLNMSQTFGEVSWKQKVFFKELDGEDLNEVAAGMRKIIKHKQRFIIATDYTTLVSIDTKTEDKLDIELKELPKHFDFFLPWAGMEKTTHVGDNPADVKAAEKMAKLFDAIKKDNPDESPEFVHGLNVFLSRLLFCFFAEDTGIFTDNQVTNAIDSHTQTDGSDLDEYLTKLFEVLDTPEKERKDLPSHLASFPFVNGSLFRERFVIPKFSRRSRQAIIDSGEMDWSDINPDIFGSMFQAVISVDQRGSLGQHYTSVPNIMKVIEPLFLNELYEEFEAAKKDKDAKTKLSLLLQRLHKIKIFDPACGSGNFLIIAYKELRRLEMKIFKETKEMPLSGIHLSQFYGIEVDDFAHEIAQLALWLAEHQMNVESFVAFGQANATLPLGDAGQIAQGNACRLDWEKVCPKKKDDEIYILGNPPYLGARMQNSDQKEDMDIVLGAFKNYRDLDYIAIWFYKGASFIEGVKSKFAFVSTNSICQGLQVSLLWPQIFEKNVEICFAHTSFKWQNNAKSKAAVIVAIVGLQNINSNLKSLYFEGVEKKVKSINAYLSDGSGTIVYRRSQPLSFSDQMSFGNMPNDGGGLILTKEEADRIVEKGSFGKSIVKKFIGASEFIRGTERFCLWIENEDYDDALTDPEIKNRINLTVEHRLKSRDKGTQELAKRPHQFRDRNVAINAQIILPRHSSVRRNYIPMGYLNSDAIIADSALAIYDPEPWLLAVLNSAIHMVWVKVIGGKIKSDYRYAKDLVYNTFPFPAISKQRKEEITQSAFRIMEEREKHSEKTLADMYDPDKMPVGLKNAHRLNDLAIDRCYRSRPFENDNDRLEHLLRLYEKMIEEEKHAGTLFAKEKKTRKKKANA